MRKLLPSFLKQRVLLLMLSLFVTAVAIVAITRFTKEYSTVQKRVDTLSALLSEGIYFTETEIVMLELSEIGPESKSAGDLVEKVLSEENWGLRIEAAKTLGYIEYEDAVPSLIELLDEEHDWRLVYASVKSLARIGSEEAIPSLRTLSKNHWYTPVRNMAAKAIDVIMGEEADLEREFPFVNPFRFEFFNDEPFDRDLIGCDPKEFSIALTDTETKVYGRISPEAIKAFNYELSYYENEYDEEAGRYIPSGEQKYKMVTPDVVLKSNDGWFAAKDRGEWGGELVHIANDGTSEVIFEDNVKDIFYTDVGVVAITGLSHLGLTRGNIVYVTQDDEGNWVNKLHLTLPSAAKNVSQLETGELLINTSHGALLFTPDGKLKMASCPISVQKCNEQINELRWVETANARDDVREALRNNDKKFIGDYAPGYFIIRGLDRIETQQVIGNGNYKVLYSTSDDVCSILHQSLKYEAGYYADSYNKWLMLEED